MVGSWAPVGAEETGIEGDDEVESAAAVRSVVGGGPVFARVAVACA